MPLQHPKALTIGRVPDPDVLIISTAHNRLRILAELHARKAPIVARKITDAFSSVHIPQFDERIARGADNEVSADGDRIHGAPVARELTEKPPRFAVPDADGGVLGA